MIYYTGDIHGSSYELERFCIKHNLSKDDIVVILGDVGVNYFGNGRDNKLKENLRKLRPTFFCIHGNHEMRPANVPGYLTRQWNGGVVWYEEQYPKLLFPKDGEIFNIGSLRHLVIGGAYSVDKDYRLQHGLAWWSDEQPSKDIKERVEKQVEDHRVDIVLSHTCPYKYKPHEALISMIDQRSVDDSTERWLDIIEEKLDYKAWFCGHWHINKRIDKMHFLFHGFESAEQFF